MEHKKNTIKEFAINMATIFVSLFLFLAIGEVVLRIVKPAPESVIVSDPLLRYAPVPYAPNYDALGWHNEHVLSRADIVAIGDSMTEGLGVAARDDAWPQVLSVLASTSVYQFARGGYGPVQYAELAKRSLALSPKIAVVDFTVGNDLYDAYDIAYHLPAWKDLCDPSYAAPDKPLTDASVRTSVLAGAKVGSLSYRIFEIRLWMRDHIRLYALLGDASRQWREDLNLANTSAEKLDKVTDLGKEDPSVAYVYDRDPRITTILSPIYRYDAVDLENPRTKEGWRITKDRFLAMKKLYGTSTTLVIVEFPTKEAVYLDMMQKKEGKIPAQFDGYLKKENEVDTAFKDFCAKNNIKCFSLRPALTNALIAGRTIYKPIMDGHPPKEGYHAIAEEIYRYVVDEHLISR